MHHNGGCVGCGGSDHNAGDDDGGGAGGGQQVAGEVRADEKRRAAEHRWQWQV